MTRVVGLLLIASCAHAPPPQEGAPAPLPTVPVPEPPQNVEGTYDIDADQSAVKMRLTIVLEEFGSVKRTKQTAFMKQAEESRGHWRREGDDVVYTIDAEETRCTRRSDTLRCGDVVLRLRR